VYKLYSAKEGWHGNIPIYCQIENDITREKFLTNQGFTVIRFENKIVFEDPEYVVDIIKNNFKVE
jgi:very-short-patch-repair endonuclease